MILKFNSNRATYKEFFGCLGIGHYSVRRFVFLVFDPSTLGSHNFLNSISSLTIFNVPGASIKGVQVLFGHQKQWSLPL